MIFARQKNWFRKFLNTEIPDSVWRKCKFRKLLRGIDVCVSIWFFIPPLLGVYFFPEYNFAGFLNGCQGIGVIILDQEKPMILCLNNETAGTHPIHNLKISADGKIQYPRFPPELPAFSFSIHNYFFLIRYNDKDFGGRDKTVWCLPMYFPVQFAEAMIQYYSCRDSRCGTKSMFPADRYSHPQILPALLDSILLYSELCLAVVLFSLFFLRSCHSGANIMILLWNRILRRGGCK